MPTTEPTCVSRVCSAARAIPKSASLTVISGGPPAGPPIDHQVAGLDVAVDDPHPVRVLEAGAGLGGDLDRGRRLERAVALQELGTRAALDVLHDDEVAAGVDAGVVDLDDVRVDQLGDGQRLAAEAGDELLVVGEVLGEDLDGDGALEHAVGGAGRRSTCRRCRGGRRVRSGWRSWSRSSVRHPCPSSASRRSPCSRWPPASPSCAAAGDDAAAGPVAVRVVGVAGRAGRRLGRRRRGRRRASSSCRSSVVVVVSVGGGRRGRRRVSVVERRVVVVVSSAGWHSVARSARRGCLSIRSTSSVNCWSISSSTASIAGRSCRRRLARRGAVAGPAAGSGSDRAWRLRWPRSAAGVDLVRVAAGPAPERSDGRASHAGMSAIRRLGNASAASVAAASSPQRTACVRGVLAARRLDRSRRAARCRSSTRW